MQMLVYTYVSFTYALFSNLRMKQGKIRLMTSG